MAAIAARAGRELIDWPTIMSALPPAYHTTLLDMALQTAAAIRYDFCECADFGSFSHLTKFARQAEGNVPVRFKK